MKVLVVVKKSFLASHRRVRRALERFEPADRARVIRADRENRRAAAEVTAHLERLGIPHDVVDRGSVAARRRYDLVISLGGDGTFFAAARHLRETPILGIKSDPENSLGLWTCGDRRSFRRPLERAIEGTLPATVIHRMALSINGTPGRMRPFNDVLMAPRNPANMSRYRLSVDGRAEDQKSSGVWIATAAGSTAGIRSAGGRRMEIRSRRFQYLVREPYAWPKRRYRFVRGFAKRLTIATFMVDSAAWIDGSRQRLDLRAGDRLEIRPGPPLTVLGYDDRRRRRLFP